MVHRLSVKLSYGKSPSPQSVSAESIYNKRQITENDSGQKTKNDQGSFHVHESWYNVNIRILVCRIIGPAASGSAGPVPAPVNEQSKHLQQPLTASRSMMTPLAP